jgi:glycosyltransferase involved in cell wall biosynthesis
VSAPDAAERWPSLSVVLPVRNEARGIVAAVEAVLAQDYPGPLELVIAHGPSRDGTAAIVERLVDRDDRVSAVENPRGSTPAGLNLAIAASSGDVVARVDGHSVIPPGYLRRAVEVLTETGADNVGGVQEATGSTAFERAVAAAMSSPFGVGDARFHYGGRSGPADTVYLGAFRRHALERVGGYDEALPRAQDADLNHRIRATGGVVWFEPSLRVRYQPRGSFPRLAEQYFTSGQWRRRVASKDPASLRWRQGVPPLTVIGLVSGVLLGLRGRRWGWLAPGAYCAAVGLASIRVGRPLDPPARRLVPLVFTTMHLCWGLGFVLGPRMTPVNSNVSAPKGIHR